VLLPELTGIGRPRWRSHVPALWRDATTMQLGDDVIIDRLAAPQVEWLRLLDGTRTSDELCAALSIDPSEARRLLRALLAAGALVDAACAPSSLRFSTVDSRDAVTQRWEASLDQHRDSRRAISAMEARDRVRVMVVGQGPLRDAIASSLDAAGLTEVATEAKATCVVLADAHHPDVPAQVGIGELERPHLHVGARGGRATVGPLVIPGSTGCLRCDHLHRRDADRSWPLIAVQWSQLGSRSTAADPLLAVLAGAHAAHLLRTWVDQPDRTDLWANRAIDVRLGALVARAIPRHPHPLCGCRWVAA